MAGIKNPARGRVAPNYVGAQNHILVKTYHFWLKGQFLKVSFDYLPRCGPLLMASAYGTKRLDR